MAISVLKDRKVIHDLIRRIIIPCLLAIVLARMYGALRRPRHIEGRHLHAKLGPKGRNDTYVTWNEKVQQYIFFDDVRITVQPKAVPNKCNAVVIGVGTTMQPWDYDTLAREIASYGYVVVFVNTALPLEWPTRPFYKLLLAVKEKLGGWLDAESVCKDGPKLWTIGGHSASGQAAHRAIMEDTDIADAVFSMDPFRIRQGKTTLKKPGLFWGFDKTTCFVWTRQAAEAAYKMTDPSCRFLYRVQASERPGEFCHCSFTNKGCPFCPFLPRKIPETFHAEVADSLNRFIKAVETKKCKADSLQLRSAYTTPMTTFTGLEAP